VGVRLALGAQPSELLTMILGQAAKLAGIGVALGVIAAAMIMPLLDSQLYGVRASDPATFLAVPAMLLAIAALAALVPARKAMRVDPVTALRIE
jgi:ABC-type antimicrobial peptide transport system permease subunit